MFTDPICFLQWHVLRPSWCQPRLQRQHRSALPPSGPFRFRFRRSAERDSLPGLGGNPPVPSASRQSDPDLPTLLFTPVNPRGPMNPKNSKNLPYRYMKSQFVQKKQLAKGTSLASCSASSAVSPPRRIPSHATPIDTHQFLSGIRRLVSISLNCDTRKACFEEKNLVMKSSLQCGACRSILRRNAVRGGGLHSLFLFKIYDVLNRRLKRQRNINYTMGWTAASYNE